MKKAGAIRAIVGAIAMLAIPALTYAQGETAAPGQLTAIDKDGKVGALCPLRRTRVNANIEGFGARVTVVQLFENPSSTPIEAIYTFPLPNDGAVDRMRMKVGNRIIEGEIKRRDEAKAIYEAAKKAGQVASLLNQERPNIFTQSVANIMPGAQVEIEISYVQLLKYEEGQFEFNFPMVVGPRYLGHTEDPGKISPPITPKGTRTGAGIELAVSLNAGAPIVEMKSILHDVDIKGQIGQTSAQITLKKKDEIPNRDFILRYRTATDSVQSAFITHYDKQKGGFFQLILIPPKAVQPKQIAPKEVIFLVDQSGSQQGFPIEKSKELMLKLIDTLHPDDTFNVAGFSNTTSWLWKESRATTVEHISEAKAYINKMSGTGGTEMLSALKNVHAAFDKDSGRLPILLFSTDGFVGNEQEILRTVRKEHQDIRMFTFGIGNGVNRFLIDGLGTVGRGDCEYVTLREKADEAVNRFVRRLENPVLTDIEVRTEGAGIASVLPGKVPDLFSEKPIMVSGRYSSPGAAVLTVSGKLGGEPWAKEIRVNLGTSSNAAVIPTLWARRQVDELTAQDTSALGEGKSPAEQITAVALEFSIMSQYTSFVAVEKKVVNVDGQMKTVSVPVEMTDGVSYEGIYGGQLLGLSMGKSAGAPMGGGGYGGGGMARSNSGGFGNVNRNILTTTKVLEVNGIKITDPAKIANYQKKVSSKLYRERGRVEVQVALTSLDPETLKKLEAVGVFMAGTDTKSKIAFVRCDAKKLVEIAQLDVVKAVNPL